MAAIIGTADDLITTINNAGFDTLADFQKFLEAGRIQMAIVALQTANSVLDAQTVSVTQANETQKNSNTQAIAALEQQLAALK